MSVEWRVRDKALFEAIEWHLLKAQLTVGQVRTLERFGWFEIVWRAQWLVVRVHTGRYPTVDLHQLKREASYLCSYDVRPTVSPHCAASPPAYLPTPLGAARRVLEAYRRGVLKPLLEASELVKEASLRLPRARESRWG